MATTMEKQWKGRWPEGYTSIRQAALRMNIPEKVLQRAVRYDVIQGYRIPTERTAILVKMTDVEELVRRIQNPEPIDAEDVRRLHEEKLRQAATS